MLRSERQTFFSVVIRQSWHFHGDLPCQLLDDVPSSTRRPMEAERIEAARPFSFWDYREASSKSQVRSGVVGCEVNFDEECW